MKILIELNREIKKKKCVLLKKKVTQTRDLRVGFFVCFCLVGLLGFLGFFKSDQERSGVRLEILKCECQ